MKKTIYLVCLLMSMFLCSCVNNEHVSIDYTYVTYYYDKTDTTTSHFDGFIRLEHEYDSLYVGDDSCKGTNYIFIMGSRCIFGTTNNRICLKELYSTSAPVKVINYKVNIKND